MVVHRKRSHPPRNLKLQDARSPLQFVFKPPISGSVVLLRRGQDVKKDETCAEKCRERKPTKDRMPTARRPGRSWPAKGESD